MTPEDLDVEYLDKSLQENQNNLKEYECSEDSESSIDDLNFDGIELSDLNFTESDVISVTHAEKQNLLQFTDSGFINTFSWFESVIAIVICIVVFICWRCIGYARQKKKEKADKNKRVKLQSKEKRKI